MTTDPDLEALFDQLDGALYKAIDDVRRAKGSDDGALETAQKMLERRRLEIETLRDEYANNDSED